MYGHPLDHFSTSEELYQLWLKHFRHERELLAEALSGMQAVDGRRYLSDEEALAIQHAAKFVIDKLVRAARSPRYEDHWDDIAGYARTAKMVLGLIQEDDG